MPTLASLLAALAPDGDGFAIDAPEAWAQGRTLYGGATAALLHAAAARAHPGLPPLRSAQIAFAGPATGRLRLATALLRRGRSSAFVAADVTGEGGVAARATLAYAAGRDSAVAHEGSAPADVPPPEACGPLHRTSRPLPGFLANYEFRHAAGARLFAGADAVAEGGAGFAAWVRFREPPATDAAPALLAIADALPCAAMVALPRPAPVSTMTWSIDLAQPLGELPPDGWWLVETRSERAADGYSWQAMRVGARDGRPLAVARQLVALFG